MPDGVLARLRYWGEKAAAAPYPTTIEITRKFVVITAKAHGQSVIRRATFTYLEMKAPERMAKIILEANLELDALLQRRRVHG